MALRRHWFHILSSLVAADRHGSGIVRDVLEQTNGELRLWPTTLYKTLDEMVDAGLIRELRGDDHPDGVSARRRYYRVTTAGRDALREHIGHMAHLVDDVLARLDRGRT